MKKFWKVFLATCCNVLVCSQIILLTVYSISRTTLNFSNLDRLEFSNISKQNITLEWIYEQVILNKNVLFKNCDLEDSVLREKISISNVDYKLFNNGKISFELTLLDKTFYKTKEIFFYFNFNDSNIENAKQLTDPYTKKIAINKTDKIIKNYYSVLTNNKYTNLIKKDDYFLRFCYGSYIAKNNLNDKTILDNITVIKNNLSDVNRITLITNVISDFKFIINSFIYYDNDSKELQDLLATTEDILNDFFENYYINKLEPNSYVGNWWNYEIGIPRRLINILPFLPDYYDNETINPWIDTILWYTRNYKNWTGGNLLDFTFIRAMCFVTKNDLENANEVTNYAINKIFEKWKDPEYDVVLKEYPFFRDGSYLDHDEVPYFGGYGVVLLECFNKFRYLMSGTVYSIEENKNFENFYKMVEVSIMPYLYDGAFSESLSGRSITRNTYGSARQNGMKILSFLTQFVDNAPKKYKDRLINFLLDNLESDIVIEYLDNNLITFKEKYKNKTSIAKRHIDTTWNELHLFDKNDDNILFGYDAFEKNNKMWFAKNQDRFTIKRDSFMLDVALTSNRVAPFEMMNKENIFGYYFSNGRTLITNKNMKSYDWKYNFGVDPFKIPGTSSIYEFDNQNMTNAQILKRYEDLLYIDKQKTSGFSNGITLDGYGIIGSNIENYNKTLWTQKSYVVIGDIILVIGKVNKTEYTDANNQKLDVLTTISNDWSYDYITTSNVNINNKTISKYQSGVNSYYVLDNQDAITQKHVIRKMNDQTMNLTNPSGTTIFEFNELYFDHSKNNNNNFIYAIVPNESNEANTISVLKNIKFENNDGNIIMEFNKDVNEKYYFITTFKDNQSLKLNDLNLTIPSPTTLILNKNKLGEVRMVMSSNTNLKKYNIQIQNTISNIVVKNDNEVIYNKTLKRLEINNDINKYNDVMHNSWIQFKLN